MIGIHRNCRRAPLLVLLAAVAAGCGGYGEVSPAAYDRATALYSICNLRLEAKLDAISAQIESASANGELTDDEANWLRAIVSDARQGNWEAAARASRRIISDQVRVR